MLDLREEVLRRLVGLRLVRGCLQLEAQLHQLRLRLRLVVLVLGLHLRHAHGQLAQARREVRNLRLLFLGGPA